MWEHDWHSPYPTCGVNMYAIEEREGFIDLCRGEQRPTQAEPFKRLLGIEGGLGGGGGGREEGRGEEGRMERGGGRREC